MEKEFREAISSGNEQLADEIYESHKKELIATQPLLVLQYYILFDKEISGHDRELFQSGIRKEYLSKDFIELYLKYFKERMRGYLEVPIIWDRELADFYISKIEKILGAEERHEFLKTWPLASRKVELELWRYIHRGDIEKAKQVWHKYIFNNPDLAIGYFVALPESDLIDELYDEQLESLWEAYNKGLIKDDSFKILYNRLQGISVFKSKLAELSKSLPAKIPPQVETVGITGEDIPSLSKDYYKAAEHGDATLAKLITELSPTQPNSLLEDLILEYSYIRSALQYLRAVEGTDYNKDLIRLVVEEGLISHILELLSIPRLREAAGIYSPIIRGRLKLAGYDEEDISNILSSGSQQSKPSAEVAIPESTPEPTPKPIEPTPKPRLPSKEPEVPLPAPAKPYKGLAEAERAVEEYTKAVEESAEPKERPFKLKVPKDIFKRKESIKVKADYEGLEATALPSDTGVTYEDIEEAARIDPRYPKKLEESLSEVYTLRPDDPDLDKKITKIIEDSGYHPVVILRLAVVFKKRFPEYEQYLVGDYKDIPTALKYVLLVLKDRLPVLEEQLMEGLKEGKIDAIYNLKTYISYLKNFGKEKEFIDELKSKYKVSNDFTTIDLVGQKKRIYDAVERGDQKTIDEILLSSENPGLILYYTTLTERRLPPEYEHILAKYPVYSLYYAKQALNDRFPAGEPTLIRSSLTDPITRGYFKDYIDFIKSIGKYQEFLVDNSELRRHIEEALALATASYLRYAYLVPTDIEELINEAVRSKDPTKIQEAFNANLTAFKEDKIAESDYIRHHLKLYAAIHPDQHNETVIPLIASLVKLSLNYLFLLYYYTIYTHNRFPDYEIEKQLFEDLDALETYAKAIASVAGVEDLSSFAFQYRTELITIKNYYGDYINKYDAIPLLVSLVS